MIVGGIYPGQYYPIPSTGTIDEDDEVCWPAVAATTKTWEDAGDLTANAWGVMTETTYVEYCAGENFILVANEDAPLIAVEDRPLVVAPDSGFSSP